MILIWNSTQEAQGAGRLKKTRTQRTVAIAPNLPTQWSSLSQVVLTCFLRSNVQEAQRHASGI